MTAGRLISAFAYEVAPKQAAPYQGGEISVTPALQDALGRTFDRSKIADAPAVTFTVDMGSPTRSHPVRDAALAIAFDTSPQLALVEGLAARLADAMDNRSKPSLLMMSVHEAPTASARRLLLWTFPQQEVFNLTMRGGHPSLELLDAFNRESNLRKAALLEGPNDRTGMLSARVLDLQSTATDRSVADFWIVEFLEAQMQMSDVEGTQLLARALRAAYTKTKGDDVAQEELSTAIGALRRQTGQRWSIDEVATRFLSDAAATPFLGAVRSEERHAAFVVEHDRFDHLIQYRRFTLSNGVVVSAPFAEIDVPGGVTITEQSGTRRLQLDAEIQEEQVRTRA
ncbi:MAG: hypothetical protein J0H56_12640 [Micrococcales bacterium]|nr:hypothetical protein [Micrococcales bacterium]